jgi:hypothetical protein
VRVEETGGSALLKTTRLTWICATAAELNALVITLNCKHAPRASFCRFSLPQRKQFLQSLSSSPYSQNLVKMARLAKRASPHEDSGDEVSRLHEGSSRQSAARRLQARASSSPPRSDLYSSDKENQTSRSSGPSGSKPKSMQPLQRPTSSRESHSNKRRRTGLGEHGAPQQTQSQTALEKRLAMVEDLRFYDPEQPMEERREVRKGYRDLTREMIGSHTPF